MRIGVTPCLFMYFLEWHQLLFCKTQSTISGLFNPTKYAWFDHHIWERKKHTKKPFDNELKQKIAETHLQNVVSLELHRKSSDESLEYVLSKELSSDKS